MGDDAPPVPRARFGTAAPTVADGRLVLSGQVEWLMEGPRDVLAPIAAALAGFGEWLGENVLLLHFGNAVGFFDAPGLGRIEVVSGKWTARHFDAMLAELMDVASGLPFAAGDAAALPYDRSVAARQDVLYHAFVYLRRVLAEATPPDERLARAIEHVLRDPHRRFERVRESVPAERAHRVELGALIRLAAGQERLVSARGTALSGLPLAQRLRGHVPLEVQQTAVQSTFDTPENRFVKTFLGQALGVIGEMRAALDRRGDRSAFALRVHGDCAWMERTLTPLARHPLWREAGSMAHLPAGSTVLQRRRGYREVYGHFARLRLAARVPLAPETVRDLLEAKDVALLYELWCFFTLVQAVERRLGSPRTAGRPAVSDFSLSVGWDLEVRWANGVRLLYNPHFSRSRPKERQSYSVPLRPDVALEVPGGPHAGLHLLDAKFRVDRLDALLPENESDEALAEEAREERRGTFKRADLYKMHTYRDAIPRACSVWILYPGTEARFYGRDGGVYKPGQQELPALLEGVGALPLQPGEAASGVDALLAHLLAEA